ncbi:MAG: hypothetical protein OXI81_17295 [Paracoccaceae bacterium]|nr:hypothetical protein [Paracoccaceae bacterium]
MPCQRNLEARLRDTIAAAEIGIDRDGPPFCALDRDGSLSGGRLNGGRAQDLAGHAAPKTTKLYGRRDDRVSLDEIERIRFGAARSHNPTGVPNRNCRKL